jgi:tRNA threonylcarbamoyladenosine biosynthesis protein TsaE
MTEPRLSWHGRTASAEGTGAVGRAIARHARPGDLVALIGELGAGKTQLVRGVAAGLGLRPAAVSSPTFVMVQEYEPDPTRAPPPPSATAPAAAGGPGADAPPLLVHVDAYRLRTPEDLESIGWDDRPQGELRRGAVVVVEWADRLGPSLGDDALQVLLTHAAPSERELVVSAPESWADRWPALKRDLDQAVAQPKPAARCPMCAAPVNGNSPHAPFCSPRCRMADLNRWFTGRYTVSRPIDQSDLDET